MSGVGAAPLDLEARDCGFQRLRARAAKIGAEALLAEMIRSRYRGSIALVSSFGIESAVLLHMVAAIDPDVPVVFLNTGKLFAATLDYRDRLIARLGLRDVRSFAPDAETLRRVDPLGDLWQRDPDRCCAIRKVEPLAQALQGFAAWINGRKRFHGAARGALPLVERVDGRIKFNPLAEWTAEQIGAYYARHHLPHHPLAAAGYASVGCEPCTSPTSPDEDVRAGRWRGSEKTECGIHFVGNTIVRGQDQ